MPGISRPRRRYPVLHRLPLDQPWPARRRYRRFATTSTSRPCNSDAGGAGARQESSQTECLNRSSRPRLSVLRTCECVMTKIGAYPVNSGRRRRPMSSRWARKQHDSPVGISPAWKCHRAWSPYAGTRKSALNASRKRNLSQADKAPRLEMAFESWSLRAFGTPG